MKKVINVFGAAIKAAWVGFWKIFSADPVASCSRLLAAVAFGYVIWEGHRNFSVLTEIQKDYLIGVMGFVIPYALNKIGEGASSVISAIKGVK